MSFVASLVPFSKYLLSFYYMPATVLDTGDTAVNKADITEALTLMRKCRK